VSQNLKTMYMDTVHMHRNSQVVVNITDFISKCQLLLLLLPNSNHTLWPWPSPVDGIVTVHEARILFRHLLLQTLVVREIRLGAVGAHHPEATHFLVRRMPLDLRLRKHTNINSKSVTHSTKKAARSKQTDYCTLMNSMPGPIFSSALG
jgi:hypothetical protein